MTVDAGALAESLRTLLANTDELSVTVADGSLLTTLDTVIRSATDALGVDSMGLMLVDDVDELRVVGAVDPLADALERAQIELVSGPGIDSLRSGRSVAVSDLAVAATYGDLWSRVATSGARAVLSSPVRVLDDIVGNLNAIHRGVRPWPPAAVRANEAFADLVAVLLRVAARARDADDVADRLRRRLDLVPGPVAPIDPDGPNGVPS